MRDATLEELPPDVIKTAFTMKEGEVTTLNLTAFVGLIRLDKITPAATKGKDADVLRDTIALEARTDISQDAFTLFSDALELEAGVELDQATIDALNAQLK
ncbi:MAG: hypothetical protein IT544_00265 [Rhodobacteraceae bacterium]|nr:hypothetical protein [Paracoccaceae bacterium]